MSLSGRLTAMSSLIVGLILVVGTITCYVVVRGGLRHQMNDQLRQQGAFFREAASQGSPGPRDLPPLPPSLSAGGRPYVQVVRPDGSTARPRGEEGVGLRVTPADLAVARGTRRELLEDREERGDDVRVATTHVEGVGALQLGVSLATVDQALTSLRLVLGALLVGGIALTAIAARLSSRSVLAPIGDLARAMSHIGSTGDLSRRVDTSRTDEVGLLATRFNAMLDELERARDALQDASFAQRQLIADASHELRTPITGLRTNIEVLLATDDRRAEMTPLLTDVVEQIQELSGIVSDVIELARGDRQATEHCDLDLADIVREGVARSRLHAPSLRFDADLASWPMVGDPERLGRAVNNVLDNAAKFSPRDGTVTIALRDGVLCVRDEGPGVPEGELPRIFDRFYRGHGATKLPGSGLGLAIVKQVVDSHRGIVGAHLAPAGGLEVTLELPNRVAGPVEEPRRDGSDAGERDPSTG